LTVDLFDHRERGARVGEARGRQPTEPDVVEKIRELHRDVKGDMIAQVGTISANNDKQIGSIIAEAIAQEGSEVLDAVAKVFKSATEKLPRWKARSTCSLRC